MGMHGELVASVDHQRLAIEDIEGQFVHVGFFLVRWNTSTRGDVGYIGEQILSVNEGAIIILIAILAVAMLHAFHVFCVNEWYFLHTLVIL